jgi:hypothetical protein
MTGPRKPDNRDDDLHGQLLTLADQAVAMLPPLPATALALRAAARGRRRVRTRSAIRVGAAVFSAAAVALAVAPPSPLSSAQLWSDVGSALLGHQHSPNSQDPYEHYLKEPARGSLAKDATFAKQVLAAWQASHGASRNASRGIFDDLRDRPHLVWAGSTPAGWAAVVVQPAVLHAHDNLSNDDVGSRTVIGFLLAGSDGTVRVVGDDYAPHDSGTTGHEAVGAWLDIVHRVALVIDPGYPLASSTAWTYTADASATRTWKPLSMDEGASVLALPATVEPHNVHLARHASGAPDEPKYLTWPTEAAENSVLATEQRAVAWEATSPCVWAPPAGASTPTASSATDCGQALPILGTAWFGRRATGAEVSAMSMAVVHGRTSDGRTFAVSTASLDSDPARVLAVVYGGGGADGTETMADAGPLNPVAALPYAVRLPNRHGWVVANVGATLRYRISTHTAWSSAGHDAALLPDAAQVEVEVTVPGRSPHVVHLGG